MRSRLAETRRRSEPRLDGVALPMVTRLEGSSSLCLLCWLAIGLTLIVALSREERLGGATWRATVSWGSFGSRGISGGTSGQVVEHTSEREDIRGSGALLPLSRSEGVLTLSLFRSATRMAPSATLSLQLAPSEAAVYGESYLLLKRRVRLQIYRARISGRLHGEEAAAAAAAASEDSAEGGGASGGPKKSLHTQGVGWGDARLPGAPGGIIDGMLRHLAPWSEPRLGGGEEGCTSVRTALKRLPELIANGLAKQANWLCAGTTQNASGVQPAPSQPVHSHVPPELIVDVTTEVVASCDGEGCEALQLARLRGLPRHDYAFRVTILSTHASQLPRAHHPAVLRRRQMRPVSSLRGYSTDNESAPLRDAQFSARGGALPSMAAKTDTPPSADEGRPPPITPPTFPPSPPAPPRYPPAPPWLPGGSMTDPEPIGQATLLLEEASENAVLAELAVRLALSVASLLALRAVRLGLRGFLWSDLLPEQRTLLPVTACALLRALPLASALQLVCGGAWPAGADAAAALLFYTGLLLFVLVGMDAAQRDPTAADGAAAWLPRALFLVLAAAPPLMLLIDDMTGGPMRLAYLAEGTPFVVPNAGFTLPIPSWVAWRGTRVSAPLPVLLGLVLAVGSVAVAWVGGLTLAFLLEPNDDAQVAAGAVAFAGRRWRLFLALLAAAPVFATLAAADTAQMLAIVSLGPAPPAAPVRLAAAVAIWLLLAMLSCPAAGMRFLTMRSLRQGAEQALRVVAVRALGGESGAPIPNDLAHCLPAKREARVLQAIRALQLYAPPVATSRTGGRTPHRDASPVAFSYAGVVSAGSGARRVAWLDSHMSSRLDFTPPWAHAALYSLALGVALTLAFYGLETVYAPAHAAPDAGSPRVEAGWPPSPAWLADYVPHSSLISQVRAAAGQGCATPTERFDPAVCSGTDVLRGAPVLVPAPATSARQYSLTLFLRAFNRWHGGEGVVRRVGVSIQLVAWLPTGNTSGTRSAPEAADRAADGGTGEWVDVECAHYVSVTIRCQPDSVACDPVPIHYAEGFPRPRKLHGWMPPTDDGFLKSCALSNWTAGWPAPAHSRPCAPVPPAAPIAPPSPLAYRVALNFAEPRAPPRELGGPPRYDLRYEALGDVVLWSRRETVGWVDACVKFEVGAALSAALIWGVFLYARRGSGRQTPQQRVLPWALAALAVFDCHGPHAPLMLFAPSLWDESTAAAAQASGGWCFAVFLLYALASIHAFAHDDLTPHADGRWAPRTLAAFWLPKLVLAGALAALMSVLALEMARITPAASTLWPPARRSTEGALTLALVMGLGYYVVLFAWVALRAPSEPLREGRRSQFLIEGASSAVMLAAFLALEVVRSGLGTALAHSNGGYATLLPPLVASGLSAADAAAVVDALTAGGRALQLLLLNLYFVAQAFFFAPSAAMRALRADAARGVDTQLAAISALYQCDPERIGSADVPDSMRSSAPRRGRLTPLPRLAPTSSPRNDGFSAQRIAPPVDGKAVAELLKCGADSEALPIKTHRISSIASLPPRPSVPPPEPPLRQAHMEELLHVAGEPLNEMPPPKDAASRESDVIALPPKFAPAPAPAADLPAAAPLPMPTPSPLEAPATMRASAADALPSLRFIASFFRTESTAAPAPAAATAPAPAAATAPAPAAATASAPAEAIESAPAPVSARTSLRPLSVTTPASAGGHLAVDACCVHRPTSPAVTYTGDAAAAVAGLAESAFPSADVAAAPVAMSSGTPASSGHAAAVLLQTSARCDRPPPPPSPLVGNASPSQQGAAIGTEAPWLGGVSTTGQTQGWWDGVRPTRREGALQQPDMEGEDDAVVAHGVSALLESIDVALDDSFMLVLAADLHRRSSPLRARQIAQLAIERLCVQDEPCESPRLSVGSHDSDAPSPLPPTRRSATIALAEKLGGRAVVLNEPPPREIPVGLLDRLLGEEMVRAQLELRCDAALRGVRQATLRLREQRQRRRAGGLREEYESMGAAGKAAAKESAPMLRLAARMLRVCPLPLCANDGAGAFSDEEVVAAHARLELLAGWTPAPLGAGADDEFISVFGGIESWVRSTREHDLASLGYVCYDALPPPRLAPKEQRAWVELCKEAAGRLTVSQASHVRTFLASRPELAGLVDAVKAAAEDTAAASRPLRYTHALLLKDMGGYTIRGVAHPAPWRSVEATLCCASVSGEASTGQERPRSPRPTKLNHMASWSGFGASSWDEYSCTLPSRGFQVDLGAPLAIRGRAGWRDVDELLLDTAAQLSLRIWLHGALTRAGDSADALACLRELQRQAESPSTESYRWGRSSRRYSRLDGEAGGRSSARRRYERELERARAAAQHAVVLDVVVNAGGLLRGEERLGRARWLPPWRDPASLIEAIGRETEAQPCAGSAPGLAACADAWEDHDLDGDPPFGAQPFEEKLVAARELLYRNWEEQSLAGGEGQQTLPLIDDAGNEVGSMVIEVRAAAAFAAVRRSLEQEEDSSGVDREEAEVTSARTATRCKDVTPLGAVHASGGAPADVLQPLAPSAGPSFWQSLSFLTPHSDAAGMRVAGPSERWKRAESLTNLLTQRRAGPARHPRRYARYLLITDESLWEDTLDALEAALAEPHGRLPRWLSDLRSKLGSRREQPQPVLVIPLDEERESAVRAQLQRLGGGGGSSGTRPRLVRAAEMTIRVVSVRTNARFAALHRARWLTSPILGRSRVRFRVTARLLEQCGPNDKLKVFSPDSAAQLLEMVRLRNSHHVGRMVGRLERAGFDTSVLKVNAQELPLVRTPAEDASAGKQLLVLLALRPEKLREQARIVRRERFEREGDPTLLEGSEPTPAEAVQIIDRLLRLPRRYGGAELRSPSDERYADLGREAGYPPPTWRVGGVELIEACYPVHDWDFNRRMEASLAWDHFFLSEAQLARLRAHYGEEIAFYFAFCDLSNRALLPVAMVGPVVLAVRAIARQSGSRVYAVLEPFYAAGLVLWGTYLLMLWRRRRAELQVKWGVEHFEGRTYERPQFHCWHNPSTGEHRYYPEWRRTAKRALSLLATLLQTVFLVFLTILIYLHYVNAFEYYTGLKKTLIASALNGMMYGLIIMGLELLLFGAISRLLTEFENYRTQSEFESAYVFKMFFFVWVDGYLWYWILGLIHIPVVREHSGPDGRIDPTFARETTIFGWRVFNEGKTTVDEWITSFETSVTFQVAGSNTLILMLENLLPVLWVWFVRSRWDAHTLRARASLDWPLLRRLLPPIARRSGMTADRPSGAARAVLGDAAVWDTMLQLREVLWEGNRAPFDVFWDMYDSVLYIGYVSVLSLQQPLFPLVVFVNNMIEIRTDLTKIGTCQRPLPRTIKDLGEWESCLWFQNFLAVLQVSLFIVFSTDLLDTVFFTDRTNPYYFVDGRLTTYVRLSVAFAFCVLLLCAIFLIRNTMGELPSDTSGVQQLRRQRLANALRAKQTASERHRSRSHSSKEKHA